MALVMMAVVDIFGGWMQAGASKDMEAEQHDHSLLFLGCGLDIYIPTLQVLLNVVAAC